LVRAADLDNAGVTSSRPNAAVNEEGAAGARTSVPSAGGEPAEKAGDLVARTCSRERLSGLSIPPMSGTFVSSMVQKKIDRFVVLLTVISPARSYNIVALMI
jgi:hypothetical protein